MEDRRWHGSILYDSSWLEYCGSVPIQWQARRGWCRQGEVKSRSFDRETVVKRWQVQGTWALGSPCRVTDCWCHPHAAPLEKTPTSAWLAGRSSSSRLSAVVCSTLWQMYSSMYVQNEMICGCRTHGEVTKSIVHKRYALEPASRFFEQGHIKYKNF